MMKYFLAPVLFMLAACSHGPDESAQWRAQSNTINVTQHGDGRLTATPPTCPTYDEAQADTLMNDPMPQLGCSTSGNLARMIADPADLVRGELYGDREAESALDGTVGAAAVQRYREGKVYAPVSPGDGSSSGSSSGE